MDSDSSHRILFSVTTKSTSPLGPTTFRLVEALAPPINFKVDVVCPPQTQIRMNGQTLSNVSEMR